jgi:hypothetical protein
MISTVDDARGFVLGGLVRTTVGRRGCCETGHCFASCEIPAARRDRAKNRLGRSRLDHDPAGIPISPVVPAPPTPAEMTASGDRLREPTDWPVQQSKARSSGRPAIVQLLRHRVGIPAGTRDTDFIAAIG